MMKTIEQVCRTDVALVRQSGLFDAEWYLASYPDVGQLDIDPVEHFLWIGHLIGRSPSPKFSVPGYLAAYADIRKAKLNPLLHYIRSGRQEGRAIYPVASPCQIERAPCQRIFRRQHSQWDRTRHERTLQRLKSLPAPYAQDKVSIIMPTWNRAARIGAAIQSALAQTHRNFELIIVDDHSTDNTADVIRAFNDPRITFVSNTRSKGVSGARNTGLQIATGDWVFFLDSDNQWKEPMVEYLLKHAAASQSSAGYCAADVQDDDRTSTFTLYASFDFESCLRANFIDLNCFFMRWNGEFRIFRFDENLRRLVDWDLILRVATKTRITGLPYVGVSYYNGNAPRITNKEHATPDSVFALQEQVRSKVRPLVIDPARIRDSSSYRIAVLLHAYHADRIPECIAYLRRIRAEFDLFVSTSLEPGHAALGQLRDAYPELRLLRFPNRGADIAPFLELVSTFKPYELVLKIHTKRDVEPWGDAWRRGLMDPILGSEKLIEDLLARFRADENLMMACGVDFYKNGVRNSIPASLAQVKELADPVGLSHHLQKDWAFVAGTMFWIRPQILLKLARMMCDSPGYSAVFQRDGAIEHGLERLLGLTLWENASSRIALVSMDGTVKDVGLGEGVTLEGVSQTMKRLAGK